QSGENAIILRKVGLAIYSCKAPCVELEDNELTVLKNALSRTPIDVLSSAAFEDACKDAEIELEDNELAEIELEDNEQTALRNALNRHSRRQQGG
ncbi:unnamed protein product, partial [marine sediment metagenome]